MRLMVSTAFSSALVPIGPSNPTWASLSCAKVNGVGFSPLLNPSRRATSPPSAEPRPGHTV
jgi:hypothetical protein